MDKLPAPRPNEDATLVARARAGEPDAWRELYDGTYEPVYRYVHARIWDEASAEDVAAEVFVAAVKGISRYRDRGKPILAWLFGIAAHAVADHQRQVGRRRRLAERLWPVGRRGSRRTDDEAQLELVAISGEDDRLIQHLDLARAVNRLTAAQREVMTLRYFVGLETTEIGQIMDKDASAVYSLHARALVALRGLLAENNSPSRDESRALRAISRVEA